MNNTNAVGWFDVYVSNMERASKFYEAVLGQKLETIGDPTGESHMKSFPTNMSCYGSGGALVQSKHAKPGAGGTMIYFSVEDCLSPQSKVPSAGGKIIRPKFSIGSFGWVSLCEDTEGNHIGFHSMK